MTPLIFVTLNNITILYTILITINTHLLTQLNPQYFRCYSPIAFGKKTDKNGDYIRKYIPQLVSKVD